MHPHTDELEAPLPHALTHAPSSVTEEGAWDEAWAEDPPNGFWRRSVSEEAELTEPTLTLDLEEFRPEFDDSPLPMPEVVVAAPRRGRLHEAVRRLFRGRVGSEPTRG